MSPSNMRRVLKQSVRFEFIEDWPEVVVINICVVESLLVEVVFAEQRNKSVAEDVVVAACNVEALYKVLFAECHWDMVASLFVSVAVPVCVWERVTGAQSSESGVFVCASSFAERE